MIVLVVLAVLFLAVVAAGLLYWVRTRGTFGTDADRATYTALLTMAQASPPLRDGLSASSATAAAPHLRALLNSAAVTLTNDESVMLAWDGEAQHHAEWVAEAAFQAASTGRQQVLHHREMDCGRADCPIRAVIVSPLEVDGSVVGTFGVVSQRNAQASLMRATTEVARYVSSQLELAELDESRSRLAHAEVRALRSQISPHFIYNALTTISACVRSDPEEARELLMEFAEFTRYSFRAGGEFTTLAEELNNIDRYLILEKARYRERLQVRLQIAPEVLPVVLPFLSLQPLVENAVRHGLSRKPGVGMVSIEARDAGAECHITVEDDGVGMDPAVFAPGRPDTDDGQHVGLSNVDERLRNVFGDHFGLVVETAPGEGTKVSMRVPKFHPGVRA